MKTCPNFSSFYLYQKCLIFTSFHDAELSFLYICPCRFPNAGKPSAEFFLSCKLLYVMNYVEFSLFPRSQLWSEYFCLIQLVASTDSQRRKKKPREHLVSDDYKFRSLLTASRSRQTEDSGHNNRGHLEMRGLYRGLELLIKREIADFRDK